MQRCYRPGPGDSIRTDVHLKFGGNNDGHAKAFKRLSTRSRPHRSLIGVETRRAFVHQAELGMAEGDDPAAPGGAVTRLLCGRHDHAGACRWPHNNAIDVTAPPARFRTLFLANDRDEPEIRARIDRALRAGGTWSVISSGSRPVIDAEQALVLRLMGAV